MKFVIIILSCFMVLVNALTYATTGQIIHRDVSELVSKSQNKYLAPNEEVNISPGDSLTKVPTEDKDLRDTAVLGKNGYEYKTVRKLHFRKRRDVSHLKLQHYLPPTREYLSPINAKQSQIPTEPSNEYLPPVNKKASEIFTEKSKPTNEYLAPVLEVSTEQFQLSNEYLPPNDVIDNKISTKISVPSNDYLPPSKLEDITKPDVELSTKTVKAIEQEISAPEVTTSALVEESFTEVPESETELIQSSAILLDDGYHYKKPLDIPDLFPQTSARPEEFLPPLDGDDFEVDGPSDGESAVLAEDGYHYRAIKRRF